MPAFVILNARAIKRIDALLTAAAAAAEPTAVDKSAAAAALVQLRILAILEANLASVLNDEDNTVVNAEGVAVRGRDVLAALIDE